MNDQEKQGRSIRRLERVRRATGEAWSDFHKVVEDLRQCGVPPPTLGKLGDAANNLFVDTFFEAEHVVGAD